MQIVNAPTTTTLVSSANPSLLGQAVTLYATVAGRNGSGTPSGSVSLQEGSTAMGTGTLDASGRATYTTSTLAPGSDAITAVYTPTGDFLGSSSMPTNQVVNAPPLEATATQLTSSANPATLGQYITFTADVTDSASGTPTGMVTFTIDGQAEPPVALAMVNGVDQATYSTTTLALGSHTIGAAYSGDPRFASSAVPNPLTETVQATTTTTLDSSANPATTGQPVTLTATVAGPIGAGTPAGSVSFQDGSTTLETVTLDASGQAAFTTATLAAGSHAIVAVYSPTGDFLGSSSAPLIQTVNAPAPDVTSTQLTSSAASSTVGQAVTFTATVVDTSGTGTPTGTVTFTIDGQVRQAPVAAPPRSTVRTRRASPSRP